MRRIFTVLALSTLLLALHSNKVQALNDPRESVNNKFGIHIINEGDLDDAAALVNSSDGEWGYVTVVVRKDERNIDRWQRAFDDMRRKKLIPIVRIATRQNPDGWEKFQTEDIENWVYFLNSLNWVVENRYVIIGNEPNHASEWGGEVDPRGYSDLLVRISKELKNASEDFFVMPAGFDASAPNRKRYMDEEEYIRQMLEKNPDLFDHVDGWVSHSYPNPGFSGAASDTGRGTIKTYDWELNYLRSLGVVKNLPVFITETGWAHNMDRDIPGLLHTDYISDNFKFAFENAWNDERIVAVTPFLLNYQDPPFDIFSWKNDQGQFYGFYHDIQKLKKIGGQPRQRISAAIRSVLLPDDPKGSGKQTGVAIVENTGQNIWNKGDISLVNDGDSISFKSSANLEPTEPGDLAAIFFTLEIKEHRFDEIKMILKISKDNYPISQSYRLSFPENSIDDLSDLPDDRPLRPRFNLIRTALPIVYFHKEHSDILASI